MRKHFHSLLLAGSAALALSACTMAPKYEKPSAPVAGEWPAAVAGATHVTNAPLAHEITWDEFFVDEKLRKLIQLALENNRDLRLAALNVQRARALYNIRRNEVLPSLNAAAGGSSRRVPADLSPSDRRATLEQYNVDLGVYSWELDFFGRIRSLQHRALEEFFATAQARRSSQMMIISSVAGAYLALAADRENMDLSLTTLKAQQGSFDLVKRRFDLGLAPELDLFRARTQVEAARADLARFRQLVAQDENALTLLVGQTAPAELLPANLQDVKPTAELSEGLPSEVLLGRPDVLQAEALLRAAYADIGAARAALLPRISLTATLGTASADLSGLFKSGSGTWSYAPQLVMPIFDTRVWAALRTTKVQREIAVTEYERAIQTAFREVADELAVRANVAEQVEAQAALVEAVAQTYRLSNFRYEQGIDDYFSVLDAQRSLYAAQQGLVNVKLARLINQARLYAVLGGGWQPAASRSLGDPSLSKRGED